MPKRHFQEKNIFENLKLFPAPSLQPVDVKVILMEQMLFYPHFIREGFTSLHHTHTHRTAQSTPLAPKAIYQLKRHNEKK